MPRGVRRVADYTHELEELNAKIKKHEDAIATLNDRKQDVVDLQKQEELGKLATFLDHSGMTVDQAIAQLQG